MNHPIEKCYRGINSNGNVLDVGCLGFRQVSIAESLGFYKLRHFGVDYSDPESKIPQDFTFMKVDLNEGDIPYEDDFFDLIVASHVIEHIHNHLKLFGEIARVCRPGGLIYVECPSERSLWLPGMPLYHEKFYSLSYFDDPTHINRPWTPQSLYRLARYYSLDPIDVGRIKWPWIYRLAYPYFLIKALLTRNGNMLEQSTWMTVGWSAYLIARKPNDALGKMPFRYYIPRR